MGRRQKNVVIILLLISWLGAHPANAGKKHKPDVALESATATPESLPAQSAQGSVLDLFEQIRQNQNPASAAKLLSVGQRDSAMAFVQGYTAWQVGHISEAKKHWQAVAADSGFADYAHFFASQILVSEKQAAEALKLVPFKAKRARRIDWDLFWLRLQILAELKQGATLRNELKTLTKAELSDRFVKAHQEFILGYSDLIARDREPALRHFTKVLTLYPGMEFDDRIFALAEAYDLPRETLLPRPLLTLRAENLIQNGLADWGYAIYEELAQSGEESVEKKALALFRARRYEEAAVYFERLLEGGDTTLDRATLLLRLSQCYNRTDNFAKAQAMYRQIQTEFPGTNNAKIARFNAAQLLLDSGQFEMAARAFEELLSEKNAILPDHIKPARWSRFWSYYLDQKWADAVRIGEAMLAAWPARDEARPALNYFLARAHEKNQQRDLAKAYYQKLLQGDETDYYALLARQRLKFHTLQPLRLINPDLLRGLPSVDQQALALPVAAMAAKYPNLVKAFVLTKLGLDTYAYDELQTLEAAAKLDAGLAQTLPAAGGNRLAYIAGYQAKSGRLPGCDAACAWHLRFPQAYATYVNPFARHWQIEPELAYAVMRQESVFDPTVVSAAFAYGLMQIIPPTEREIAEKILNEPVADQSLLDPKWNVLFGTYYLKQLSSDFSGELAPTIAAYNAGPYNVSRWLKRQNHSDWDEFVELIPYSETKTYVKRVLVNYWVYSQIYLSI